MMYVWYKKESITVYQLSKQELPVFAKLLEMHRFPLEAKAPTLPTLFHRRPQILGQFTAANVNPPFIAQCGGGTVRDTEKPALLFGFPIAEPV